MTAPRSDALVVFGATGELAYKKIFPALQAMILRGHLDMPVVGVGRSKWTPDQFNARAKDSLEQNGGLDPAAFAKRSMLLNYVDGDYGGPTTFANLRKALGAAQRPLYYLVIPPSAFTTHCVGRGHRPGPCGASFRFRLTRPVRLRQRNTGVRPAGETEKPGRERPDGGGKKE